MNWIKQRVGLEDPIYGASAVQSVAQQDTPYTVLKREDLKWFALDSTAVETQTFYATADSGHSALAQIIYSNVGGLRTTCQFTSKLFFPSPSTPQLWTSDALSNWNVSPDKYSFTATNCSLTLSEDGNTFHVHSSTNKTAIVDMKFTRVAPGVMAGTNGTTTYGTDPKKPWGSMYHAYWPRCTVTGNIVTQKHGPIDMSGRGMYVHALQGMRPNLSAASHNFCNFQGPTYSAVMWEFTTPPSYGSTSVSVGCVATDDKIIVAGAMCKPSHTASKTDSEVGWPEPTAMSFEWHQKDSKAGAQVDASWKARTDRIDVLQEVPGFVKAIMAQAGGLKPYIYQFVPEDKIQIKVTGEDGEVKEEEGRLIVEATFISGHGATPKTS